MADLLTAAQMRAVEAAAIASGAASGRDLMERAGAGVVAAAFARWPELVPPSGDARGPAPAPPEYFGQRERQEPAKALVFCGPGNNGGDGFVIARLLRERGLVVTVYAMAGASTMPPDARAMAEAWAGPVAPLPAFEGFGEADLLVDALFGTGLTRPLSGAVARLANALAEAAWSGARVVAVDAPSGLCLDSGRPLSPPEGDGVAAAALTVSFHGLKLGHLLARGPLYCGEVVVCDIGLARRPVPGAARQVEAPQGDRLDKGAAPGAHKYNHGHALIVAGGAGQGGAARLAARAALRVGAGLVTLAPSPEAMLENAARLNAVMLRPLGDRRALAEALADRRLGALALGPGLGLDRARALVPEALASGRAVVLDADALTAFAEAPEALFAQLHGRAVLTPHGGEFARLFPDLAAALAAPATAGPALSKLDVTLAAAARAGAVVVFKGADTVIAAPDGRAFVHAAAYERAAPWLATAGAGDVLTGLIAGLMARGAAPLAAARDAAWLHVEAARRFGPGLIAEDLPEMLPEVLAGLIQ